jgi:hypothetical protein
MISIVCVFNDQKTLELNLLQSLKQQNIDYELILIDNKNNASFLPAALNYGALKAKGNYLMFVHQDVELIGESWLRKAEEILDRIKDLGAAGVAGIDETGLRCGFIIDRGRYWGSPIKSPTPIMTLDEQIIIIPKRVFECLKIDKRFKWHSWAADYCLGVRSLGLRPYVIPLMTYHNSSTLPIREVGKLDVDDLSLVLKYKGKYKKIHKTTGTISLHAPKAIPMKKRFMPRQLTKIFIQIKNIRSYGFLSLHDKYLDVGTIPIEQPRLKNMKHLKETYSVGLSDKPQYLYASKRLNVHSDYVLSSLKYLPFKPRSFDLIILHSCLEYLPKSNGKNLIEDLELLGERIVLTCPNNGIPLGNTLKTYKSRWSIKELQKEGYRVYGIQLQWNLPKMLKIFTPVLWIFQWFLPLFSAKLIAFKICETKKRLSIPCLLAAAHFKQLLLMFILL